jgi:hypothetical protein
MALSDAGALLRRWQTTSSTIVDAFGQSIFEIRWSDLAQGSPVSPRMEFTQIRHFIAVAETGSFTKGAQRATVSQPAISASIAKLEAYFDVKLLDRRRA